ncbi:XkdF-like putative serine protease domain-containing protein [Virgibacillus sp. SK37]|uniref:XkdF-like putative serine protease domain-containing protein n=1 Tax=Virgibacillus sp. SK37 TaxID=403957 RepID=UPI0004D1A4CA|nr:XkdF-like putative serine protease domain-containing protein [Virgibacillus sp. SK37]AIF45650.1 hypothetical protein X953_18840 [Virgibacillus sp. SK37]
MPELSSPIIGLNKDLQIMTGAVLIPDEPDTDGDVVTKSQIEALMYEYMEKYQNSDLQHSLNNVAKVVESYLLPFPMTVKVYGKEVELPIGTWIMSVKVSDPDIWQAVLDGKLTGFSIMGVRRSTLEDFSFKSATNEQLNDLVNKSERTTLAELGDFVITHVSIVDKPAVPKAEFFAFKSKELEEKGLFKRFVEFMKDERAKKSKGEDVEMTKEELKDFILSVVKGAETEEVEEDTTTEEVEETTTQEGDTTEEDTSASEETNKEDKEDNETSTEEETNTEETDKKSEKELTDEYIKNLIKTTIMELSADGVNSGVGGTSKKSAKSRNKSSEAFDFDAEAGKPEQGFDFYEFLGRDKNGVKKEEKGEF